MDEGAIKIWLERKGSNLRRPVSKTGVLPLDDSPDKWLPREDSHLHNLINSQACYFDITRELNGGPSGI